VYAANGGGDRQFSLVVVIQDAPNAESVLHPGVQLQRPGARRSIVRVFRLRDGMDKRSARHASVSRSAICPANSVQGEATADVADITEERGPR